jgi:hypothetical protein
MTNLWDLKIGDPVMVEDVNRIGSGRRLVTKVGHKYVHIGGEKYDRTTGRVADDYGHRTAYTLSQWEQREQVAKAREGLKGLGLSVATGVSPETVLRMAELLKPMLEERS